ncbi:MAG: phosphate ABC transporter permease protein [Candidatus Xenolissoclinum pacificiensis L6]|uniref:Phosphate ABC transporter permease protein n=1 Tax=Candidatus Xenolissoclinum pacificiensis L6 TaxID=1401685 RepID=W2V051_9RICK|nr:MAG: phosphate ABC transporter permease protein [Candidatus Xenolissoclinum pacificiensis L6]
MRLVGEKHVALLIRSRKNKDIFWACIAGLSLAVPFMFFIWVAVVSVNKSMIALTKTKIVVNCEIDHNHLNDKGHVMEKITQCMQVYDPSIVVEDVRNIFSLYLFPEVQHFLQLGETNMELTASYSIALGYRDFLSSLLINKSSCDSNDDYVYEKLISSLYEHKCIKRVLNYDLIKNGDSIEPVFAGIRSAMLGSMAMLSVCLLFAAPIGVLTAIYLQEILPCNSKFKMFLELGISNLASTPSIIFGIFGLSLYINYFGVGRGTILVGALTLLFVVLPTVVISTREGLAAVPYTIREAALALGASKLQVVFHFLLPMSMNSVISGILLGMARIIGETAPLILVGMSAFVREFNVFSNNIVLPVQIYNWSQRPESFFIALTHILIIILILVLLVFNIIADIFRRKSNTY